MTYEPEELRELPLDAPEPDPIRGDQNLSAKISLLPVNHKYLDLGECDIQCSHCKAFHWRDERVSTSSVVAPEFDECCKKAVFEAL